MIVQREFGVADEAKLAKAVAKLERMLKPDVVRIRYSVEPAWDGEPSVFFRVLLTDEASKPPRLYEVGRHVRSVILKRLDPLNAWGLFPYVNVRSESEQADLKEASWE